MMQTRDLMIWTAAACLGAGLALGDESADPGLPRPFPAHDVARQQRALAQLAGLSSEQQRIEACLWMTGDEFLRTYGFPDRVNDTPNGQLSWHYALPTGEEHSVRIDGERVVR